MRTSRKDGFALVLTVTLLSLLILTLVAIATLTRVETAIGANADVQADARQNALLALNVALGRLQEAAGPDQRVTATAEILPPADPADLANRKWTGVWRSTDGVFVDWLVSGESRDARTAPPDAGPGPDDGVELVGSHTADISVAGNQVVVAREPIGGPTAAIGHFAYWIGDEGVKARVNLVDPYKDADATDPEGEIRATVAQRVGVEEAVAGYPANSEDLRKVLSRNQLPFAGGVSMTLARAHFHDLTPFSAGVISDAAAGGLKEDLNRILADTPAGFENAVEICTTDAGVNPTWGAMRAFYSANGNRLAGDALLSPVAVSASAVHSQGIFPLVTALTLRFGARLESGNLVITIQPTLVMTNPYDIGLTAADYEIGIQNGYPLPVGGVVVLRIDGSDIFPSASGVGSNFNEIFGGSFRLRTSSTSFAPGEVKIFGVDSGSSVASGIIALVEGFNPAYMALVAPSVPFDPSANVFQVGVNGGEYNLSLSVVGGSELQRVLGIVVVPDALHTHGTFPIVSATGQTLFMRGAAGWGAMKNDGSPATIRWMPCSSPRSSSVGVQGGDEWVQNPVWDTKSVSTQVTLALAGPSFGSLYGEPNVALFHVPSQEPLSLGQFQHVGFFAADANGYRFPTYAIGSSYASPYVGVDSVDLSYGLNAALWDHYFCSGFVDADFDSNPLPNQRLRHYSPANSSPLPSLDYQNVAARLLIDGPFNVNSTSVDAWTSLLGSLNDLRDPSGNSANLVANAVLRTPRPTDDMGNYCGGIRSMSDDQTRRLAAHVVAEIRARGPFVRLADFVNRKRPAIDSAANRADAENQVGALQRAIDSTLSVTIDGTAYPPSGLNPPIPQWEEVTSADDIPSTLPFREAALGAIGTNLTGWLSQGDILTAIGPFLSVRSDTFLIRAYGEAVNPELAEDDPDYVQGRAWCEAVVQRVPEYVDTTDQPWESGGDLEPINQQLGRRFVIVQFRWLTAEDI